MVFINTTFPKRKSSCFNWVCQCTGGWCIAPVGVYQGGADVHPSIPAEIGSGSALQSSERGLRLMTNTEHCEIQNHIPCAVLNSTNL